ncbi:MAG: leucine-rich repeat domain-containing protein [Tannerellaceae bacterium]|jgi:hypothetical protein|nr:leucine-rich repeat domain-containing protein [Tannerellaceae bacterium]
MKIKTILLTVICFACTSSVSKEFTDGDFTFIKGDGSGCTLIDYSGAGGDVIIPSVATKEDGSTYVVTAIGLYAFYYNSDITSVIIPDGVLEIEMGAFYACYSLAEVIIPNSVTTIEEEAFASCDALASITIPSSVTVIGEGAFRSCRALTAINVADVNIAWTSEDGVLYDRSKSLLHSYPAGKSGPSFTIPSSVTEIGDLAFYICDSLSSITIPSSVTTIGNSAFTYCGGLTELVIPNSVTVLGEGSFSYCGGLTSITIPSSVTTIGEWAFAFCDLLRDMTVSWPTPQSVNLEGDLFMATDLAGATLHVPPGTRALYQAHKVWGGFGAIIEEGKGEGVISQVTRLK